MKVISIGTDENILVKGSRTYNRIREYSDLVDEYYCLVFTKNFKARNIEDGNFKVIPVKGRNKFMQVVRLVRIFHFAKKLKGAVISSQDAFEIGLLSYFFAEKYNLKLLVQIHTDISTKLFYQESIRNMSQYFMARFVLKHADVVRVVSAKMQRYLIRNLRVPKKKVHLLPIFIDTREFKFKLKKNSVLLPKNILMISRIEEVKNIPLGIRAVQAYRRISGGDHKLRIVGKGNLKEKYLKRFKDRKWIEWADWTKDVEREYHNADLLLVTSNYEGWGLTAVESVACGTPVAISPVGVANEFIIDGVNGYVARGHDIVNIMEAIYGCFENEFDAATMKQSLKTLDTKSAFFRKFKSMIYS